MVCVCVQCAWYNRPGLFVNIKDSLNFLDSHLSLLNAHLSESFEQCSLQLLQTLCGRRLANKKTNERAHTIEQTRQAPSKLARRREITRFVSIYYGFTYEEFSMSPKRKLPSFSCVVCNFMATHRICAPFFSVVVHNSSSAA